ncbi:hypothetical protein [Pantanalinema sp. GBBB05]|uniref:hypothetical protein n=1 Tax=Pantanalinema sp. GBBB05 TaxID=2604139 RepID=UPI001D55DEA9|nr:hypothetical protein [Pantanalinema sp. GBBB05]
MKTDESTLSWYPVPADTKRLLQAAAAAWEDTASSEALIHQAIAQTQTDLNVLVAAYRYFFYKNNNSMALQMAHQVLEQVQIVEQLPMDWEQLKPILISRKEDPNIRLYLNAYAASGLVLARLGDLETAKVITTRVSEIDDRKEFGASTILDVLTRPLEDDE